MKKAVTMKFNSEKKHSVRYDCEAQDALLTSVYVRKADLPRPFPQNIVVTVEA